MRKVVHREVFQGNKLTPIGYQPRSKSATLFSKKDREQTGGHPMFANPVKMPQALFHNELRSNSKMSQAVSIRSHTQSQPVSLKPVISKHQRQGPTAGSRLGVDTRVGLSPRKQVGLPVLPEGACGRWDSRRRRRAGMSRGGTWTRPGRAWGGGAWRGLAELVLTIMVSLRSR